MEISLLLKIAGIGLLVSVFYQILAKSGREEQAMLVSVTGIIIVLFILIDEIGRLFESIQTIFGIS